MPRISEGYRIGAKATSEAKSSSQVPNRSEARSKRKVKRRKLVTRILDDLRREEPEEKLYLLSEAHARIEQLERENQILRQENQLLLEGLKRARAMMFNLMSQVASLCQRI
ncbi:uncharacterized protein N7483_008195 [Penicillium malachiteum]|uniref:uncharacterized protein n=1 Tax=Penicillium malachiteum TaxID=1324776 RepID=UPI0025494C42|nr:uncharacterized protein N7483_008195 [Penicillium malachiteum]KAJ5720261.1 hypothetical protein N7483_008195 [Penicillium malachiteum]